MNNNSDYQELNPVNYEMAIISYLQKTNEWPTKLIVSENKNGMIDDILSVQFKVGVANSDGSGEVEVLAIKPIYIPDDVIGNKWVVVKG